MTEEIWKEIEGFDSCYQVSNKGRVKSVARIIHTSNNKTLHRKERILTIRDNQEGYPVVRMTANGVTWRYAVHRLVAKAFLVYPNDGKEYVVNHIDCDPHNNCVENLEYVTQAGNVHHAFRMGNHYSVRNYLSIGKEGSKKQILLDAETKKSIESPLSHKGSDNGRARRIQCVINGELLTFSYSGDYAQYLAENYITYATHLLSIQQGIRRSAREHIPYWGIQFEYID